MKGNAVKGNRKWLLAMVSVLALVTTACWGEDTASSPPAGTKRAEQVARDRQNYEPKNDVEGRNYNARLRIADDPATLVWCTSFPTNPNAPLITVPIVGKLTSGNKRPYPTQQEKVPHYQGGGFEYNPELPGPDGFYGSSGEYRYGFRPDGVYVDFYNLETYCTTEPTTFQREKTLIDLGSDAGLSSVDAKVQEALKACQAKQTNKTVVTACPEAQAALVARR